MLEVTEGWLLNGRVRYAQPADGYRTGLEPVLLAASIPAKPGDRVLEAGTGAGAALLCLAARVAGLSGVGVEIDPAMATLARQNLAANGGTAFSIATADLGAWQPDGLFDHAFANPPWHDRAATPSPVARRHLATHEGALPVESWIESLHAALRPGGSLTLIVPASQAVSIASALPGAGLGAVVIVPLWPKLGRDAKLAIVQGLVGRTGPGRLAPGLVLHEHDGQFTTAADALLRNGGALMA